MNIKPLFNNNETPTLEEYLYRCGVDNPTEYINPSSDVIESPSAYNDIDKAVELLCEVIHSARKGQIIIVCDSDCDGYCSASIAAQFLNTQGVGDRVITLFHSGKQHGLSKDILKQLHNCNNISIDNIDLIWIPDAGTNDTEACSYLSLLLNIPVLITDHHKITRENSDAIIISNQINNVKNQDLCGTGVTHKVISAYEKIYGGNTYKNVLDYVALATISDVCDVRSLENRIILKWGLSHINNKFLRAMCDTFVSDEDITPTNLAWNVVPKINAVCRSNDMELKKDLFLAMTYESDIANVIDKIAKAHRNQREEVNRLYEDTLSIKPIGDKVKIFKFINTPYTGLIASKLSDHYACPCMVVHQSNNIYTGSLRSPCPLRTNLDKSGLMTLCQGHEQACGVGWEASDTEKLSNYCESLDLSPAQQEVMLSVDTPLISREIFAINECGKNLWGHGIPEPNIHISDIHINGKDIKEIGATKSTIKFLYGDIEVIKFFCTKEFKKKLNIGKSVNMELEIIGKLNINTFRGRETKQIIIDEIEVK